MVAEKFMTNTYVMIGPDTNVKALKLCKDCKHFAHPPGKDLKYGKCKIFGEMSLVDGTVEYKYASSARMHDCRGKYHETEGGDWSL